MKTKPCIINIIENRDIFKEYIKEIAKPQSIVLDIGACKPFNRKLSVFRTLFVNCHYIPTDINKTLE